MIKNIGIVLAGGSGERFGSDLPKQFLKINNQMVINFSFFALKNAKEIQKILIVSDLKFKKILDEVYFKEYEFVRNGKTRNESIYNALLYIKNNFKFCENIIILDSARPMIKSEIVNEYILLLNNFDAVITAQKITDSIGRMGKHVLDRNKYYLIQAPEAFKFKKLFESFDKDSKITSTNQQMPKNYTLYKNFNFKNNFKITYKHDLKILENILKEEQ